MKILFKTVTSCLSVSTLLSSLLSISASANNWYVRNIPGAPSSINQYLDIQPFYNLSNTSNVTSISESCTVANFHINEGGQSSRARYYCHYYNEEDGVYVLGFVNHYHTTSKQDLHNISTNPIPPRTTYYVYYVLEYYNGYTVNYVGTIG